ncbi:MAG: histidinol-phosphatase HisJ family protein [Oscillospiraceae bacterium]
MFLADYHVHTEFSPDAHVSMAEMAEAAVKRGMSQICFTDHVDIEYCKPEGVFYDPHAFSRWDEMRACFDSVKATMDGRLNLRFGVELSAINHHLEDAERIASMDCLDFVIGSVHNLRDMNDFYFLKYDSDEMCRELFDKYIGECFEVAHSGCCDVLGHFGYTNRYMIRQGYTVDMLDFTDRIKDLFHLIARNGIGIEINTSGLRDKLHSTIPSLPLLKLYRECGGEVVTVGSDAHTADAVGTGIKEAYELLEEAGFRFVTTFKNRRREFIRLRKLTMY